MDTLLRVARGQQPADVVLAGGTVVDVLAGALRRAAVAIAVDVLRFTHVPLTGAADD